MGGLEAAIGYAVMKIGKKTVEHVDEKYSVVENLKRFIREELGSTNLLQTATP